MAQIWLKFLKDNNGIGVGDSFEMIAMILFATFMIVFFSAYLLSHISGLQTRLRRQMTEYYNLINRMHEGVLVLVRERSGNEDQPKTTTEIKFFN